MEPLDPVLHEGKRLGLLAVLRIGPETFSQLKHDSQLTDGNLEAHLKRLEDIGYIARKKRMNPLLRRGEETVFAITEKGKAAFENYLEAMERKIKEARKLSSKPSP
jgi:DNA-binding MarR family transcriptional regulator